MNQVIGGADGPTSIFLAGTLGGDLLFWLVIIGIVLLVALGVVLLRRKFKNRKKCRENEHI